jgi:microcystin-dependent protein
MNLNFKLSFCLVLFVFNSYTLFAQDEALVITPEGNVNIPNGKLQENGNALLPKGAIIMWYGTNSPPAGWAICDGNNGTPDLRGRFIVGIGKNEEGTEYKQNDKGGEDKPAITEKQLPAHSHYIDLTTTEDGLHGHGFEDKTIFNQGSDDPRYQANGDGKGKSGSISNSTGNAGMHLHKVKGDTKSIGNGEKFDNRPKYYALYYIMKL